MGQAGMNPEINRMIREFVEKKQEELKEQYPNVLLRDETLKLLEQYCTVLYYPLQGETNNGFHIDNIPTKDGKLHHFVYLNTAQTLEKQVFTAAHELGHIWRVDDHIQNAWHEKHGRRLKIDEDLREQIINRFAAELLMPAQYFKAKFHTESKEKIQEDGTLRLLDMLRIVAKMMEHFFVPWKSVVYRFGELGILPEADTKTLLGEGELSLLTPDLIEDTLDAIKTELGYEELFKTEERKWIEGLPELLDRAASQNVVSKTKLEAIYQTFGLEKKTIDPKLKGPTIRPLEGC